MKKVILYFLVLMILMVSCISDFSFPGIPWNHEIEILKIKGK